MTSQTIPYGLGTTVPRAFDATVTDVRAALAAEGFGILMEADLQATFKKKLERDAAPYVILGACSPREAFEAVALEPDIGLLLPCNVIVRGVSDGTTAIAVVDPVVQLGITGRAELEPVASAIRERLVRALKRLEAA